MSLEIIPAHDLSLADQAAIFSRAFAGYVGGSFEMVFCPAVFPDRFGQEIFQPLGFAPDPLSQFLMRKSLS